MEGVQYARLLDEHSLELKCKDDERIDLLCLRVLNAFCDTLNNVEGRGIPAGRGRYRPLRKDGRNIIEYVAREIVECTYAEGFLILTGKGLEFADERYEMFCSQRHITLKKLDENESTPKGGLTG